MPPEITTLSNGLRIVSHEMAHLETTSLGVWVAAGARHESERENGISHLLEHMAFKGTRRRTARQIAEEIEAVGGDLNAATSLETTAYYARVLKGDEEVALEIIADILQESLFAEEELEREREVILQEIAGIKDSPDDLGYDLVQEAAFPDQPVGRPVIGTPETVKAITAGDLRNFLGRRYLAPRIVVAAAGAVNHTRLARHAGALFGGLSSQAWQDGPGARYSGGVRSSPKPFEQSHLLLGFEGPSYRDGSFYAAQVLSGLFGGGMSSRLFQEVREVRGLCYAIYSSAWGLGDSGVFGMHAPTSPELMEELIKVVAVEIGKIASTAPDEREVARSKAQLKAGLLMSLESSSARAEQMARQLLGLGRLLTVDELIQRVDEVTPEAIRVLAEQLSSGTRPSVAVVGAGKRSTDLARLASEAVAA